MDIRLDAENIDKELRKQGIMKIRKSDLRAKFNIHHNQASAIWSALTLLDWYETWSYLERKK